MSHQNDPSTEVEQPEWLKNFVPKPGHGRGNPNWVKGGPSPNPHGKSVNLGGPRTQVTKLLQENVCGILEKQIEKALEGDSAAASLVLSRVLAPLRSNAERVSFDFDPELPIGKQVEQVLAAVAAGRVPPDVAQMIVGAISNLASVRATEDLEARIIQLEAKEVR